MESPARNNLLLVPEDPETRQLLYRRLKWGAALLLILLIAISVKPAARKLRNWHAKRLAEQGLALLEMREWKKAAENIGQAFRLDPTDSDVQRSEANLLSQVGRFSSALSLWKQLGKEGATLSSSEYRRYAIAALEEGDFSTALEQAKHLGGAAADRLVAAKIRDQIGDHETALQLNTLVLSAEDSTNQERYQSSVFVWQNASSAPARKIAWDSLGKISEGEDSAAFNSLLFITQQRLSPSAELLDHSYPEPDIPTLIDRLGRHPQANTFSRLREVDLRIKMNPSEEESQIDSAVSKFSGADNDTLGTLVSWLLAHRRAAQAVAMLPTEKAAETTELSALRILGLSALNDWQTIESELERPAPALNLDELTVEIYLARAAARLGEEAALRNRWDRAFELAAGDKRKMIVVARAAENEKLFEKAENAYEAAVAVDPHDRANFGALLRFAAVHRGAGGAYQVLLKMTERWPDDPGLRNAEIHAGLLAHELPPAGARATMEALVRDYPSDFSYRATLALLLLQLNEPVAALRAFGDSVTIADGRRLLPSTLAIHAVALAANDMATLARMEAETIPLNELVGEERALLQQQFVSESVN